VRFVDLTTVVSDYQGVDEQGNGDHVGEFRTLRRLGEGAAGEVFLATPLVEKPYASPGELVAVKRYKPSILSRPNQLKRIEREARVGTTLSHEHLVRIYDYVAARNDDAPHLVMEYVDGFPLASWVGMFHPPSSPLLLQFVDELLDALEIVHGAGMVHRDVKPGNLMVSSRFSTKLMDFGVVSVADEESLTGSDDSVGTRRNTAPELLRDREYDTRSDLYSLGTVIYFLLHGYEIFAGVTQSLALSKLIENDAPEFDVGISERDDVAETLSALATRLLQKKPEDRPQSVGDAREMLDRVRKSPRLTQGAEPLYGYMATALTGAPNRDAIAFPAKAMADAAREFEIYVYQPRRATDPVLHADVEPSIVYWLDRQRVEAADVVIALLNEKSFGVGQELEMAAALGKPLILVHREEIGVSRMILGSFANVIGVVKYETPEDLVSRLRAVLRDGVKSIRRARKFAAPHGVPIGERLRARRLAQGFKSPEEFAEACGISSRFVSAIENGEYRNVGFDVLVGYCRALDTSIGELLGGIANIAPADAAAPDNSHQRNLQLVEDLSARLNWSVLDMRTLKQEYLEEFAARKRPRNLEESDVLAMHEALEKRKLKGNAG
jgi:serine/threonine-protein kinase